MQLGIVSPPNMLRKYAERFSLQHCYVSVAVGNLPYLDYYKGQVKKGKTVILEWSPTLPRVLCRDWNLRAYERCVKGLNPTWVVLPSKDFDMESTVREAYELQSSLNWPLYRNKCIGLLQGGTLKEIQECYTHYIRTLGITSIGLASPLELVGPRNVLLEKLNPSPQRTCDVFFFETHRDVFKEFPPAWVKGFSTSYPVRLGLEGRSLTDDSSKIPAPLDFMSAADNALIRENIQELEELLP